MARGPSHVLSWLAPTRLYLAPDERRRVQLIGVLCLVGVLVGTGRAAAFALLGQHTHAGLAAGAGLTSLTVLIGLRSGRFTLFWGTLAMLSAVYGLVTVVAVRSGGTTAQVLGIMGMLPLAATYVLGGRVGAAWLALIWITVLSMFLSQASGLAVFDDTASPTERLLLDTVVALVSPLVLLLLAVVYERSRIDAQASLLAAERMHARAEQSLQSLQTEKMATVGLLAAGVGHEINNPLTSVLGNLDYTLSELNDHDHDMSDVKEALTEARDAAVRIGRITQDLRMFSRADGTAVLTPIDLNDAAAAALRLTRRELLHRGTLNLQFGSPLPVMALESRIVQVVVNLLVNAFHAIEGAADGEIYLRTGSADGLAWLEVADNGHGIPDEVQAKIFDPFFTTKEAGRGTGLGLSISHSILRSMGGSLEVDSTEGAGTTFRLYAPSVSVPPVVATDESANVATTRRRILIVDDEVMVSRSLTRMLRRHEVISCQGGPAAVALLDKDSHFDVVLCDLMMIPMTGWDVLNHIKGSHPGLEKRFAFMTGGVFTSQAHDKLAHTDVPVLHKPFEMVDVDAVVELLGTEGSSSSAVKRFGGG